MSSSRSVLACGPVVVVLCACGPSVSTSPPPLAIASIPSSSAPVVAVAPPSPAPRPVPALHVAARRVGSIGLLTTSDGKLYLAADVVFAVPDASGALHRDDSLTRGVLPGDMRSWPPDVDQLVGRSPDALFLTLDVMGGGGRSYQATDMLRFTPNGWAVTARPAPPPHTAADDGPWVYQTLTPWTSGALLGLMTFLHQGFEPSGTTLADVHTDPPRLVVVSGPAGLAAPVLDPDLCPSNALSFPTGEVVVFGDGCGGAPRVQRWDAHGQPSREALPVPKACTGGAAGVPYAMVGASGPSDVYLAANLMTCARSSLAMSPLWHFDGQAWSLADVPGGGSIQSLSVTPDGYVWVVAPAGGSTASVFRRDPGGHWDPVDVPGDPAHAGLSYTPTAVFARSADDVWVSADANDPKAPPGAPWNPGEYATISEVVHGGQVGDVLELPDGEGVQALQAELSPPIPLPPGDNPPAPFILVGALPDGAADPFDYAPFAKALRGETVADQFWFEEVVWHGKRWFGAEMLGGNPSKHADIMHLARTLSRAVAWAQPQLFATFYPKVVRKFSVDWHAGVITAPPS